MKQCEAVVECSSRRAESMPMDVFVHRGTRRDNDRRVFTVMRDRATAGVHEPSPD